MKYSHRKEEPPKILKKFDKRAWTLNYGIGIDGNGDGIPDVDNNTNWLGGSDSTVWVYVVDKAEPAPGRLE